MNNLSLGDRSLFCFLMWRTHCALYVCLVFFGVEDEQNYDAEGDTLEFLGSVEENLLETVEI